MHKHSSCSLICEDITEKDKRTLKWLAEKSSQAYILEAVLHPSETSEITATLQE